MINARDVASLPTDSSGEELFQVVLIFNRWCQPGESFVGFATAPEIRREPDDPLTRYGGNERAAMGIGVAGQF
jgi:hypothetical protein